MSTLCRVTATARPYQIEAVDAAIHAATSGILSLPCGAGKTLIAIMLAARRGGDTLILCNTNEVVQQFVDHFTRLTDLAPAQLLTLTGTSHSRMKVGDGATSYVMLTTYAMMATTRGRSERSRRCIQSVVAYPWHTVVMDEVHCAAATAAGAFRRKLKARAIYGLTATLVRADNGIDSLLNDIGPRLFEMKWRSLETCGHTARVHPVVVFCELPPDWGGGQLQRMAEVLNPMKVGACDAIRGRHKRLGEKILIFCDKLWACETLAQRYMCPYLTGDTPEDERAEMLTLFRCGTYDTLVLSRVGDTGWDLDASVGVVIDAHFGSERQEAQRIGRIMRPNKGGMHSTFYDLVTDTAQCVDCFWRRQAFASTIGYEFAVTRADAILEGAEVSDDDRLLSELAKQAMAMDEKVEQRQRRRAELTERRASKKKLDGMHPLFKKRAVARTN